MANPQVGKNICLMNLNTKSVELDLEDSLSNFSVSSLEDNGNTESETVGMSTFCLISFANVEEERRNISIECIVQ